MDMTTLLDIKDNVSGELTDAANGEKTSFLFIKNQLPDTPLLKVGETMQTMVAGGSVFRSALVTKTENGLEVRRPQEKNHGSFDTKESFMSYLSENLAPDVKLVALNLGHGLEPVFRNGILDGKLITAAKEHKFEGLLGENVGEELEKYSLEKAGRDIKVSVANDTICLMLSGLTKYPAENLAAGIVGTGTNFAIFLDKTIAVNLEAGGFDNFQLSPTGEQIDSASNQQDFHLFEKEIAGAYLFEHFNLAIKEKGIDYPLLTDTQELDKIIRDNTPEVAQIAQDIFDRSAQLSAVMIAGIVDFYKRDVTFVMLGSLFWKAVGFKEMVESTVKELVPDYKVTFDSVENADYLGAAKLIA